jgi:hypothetical protein
MRTNNLGIQTHQITIVFDHVLFYRGKMIKRTTYIVIVKHAVLLVQDS